MVRRHMIASRDASNVARRHVTRPTWRAHLLVVIARVVVAPVGAPVLPHNVPHTDELPRRAVGVVVCPRPGANETNVHINVRQDGIRTAVLFHPAHQLHN